MDDSTVSFVTHVFNETKSPYTLNSFLQRSIVQIDSICPRYLQQVIANITAENFIHDADLQRYKAVRKVGLIPLEEENIDAALTEYMDNVEDFVPTNNDIRCWQFRLNYSKQSLNFIENIISIIQENLNNDECKLKSWTGVTDKVTIQNFPSIIAINEMQNEMVIQALNIHNSLKTYFIEMNLSSNYNIMNNEIADLVEIIKLKLNDIAIEDANDSKFDNVDCSQDQKFSENDIDEFLYLSKSLKNIRYTSETLSIKKDIISKCLEKSRRFANDVHNDKFIDLSTIRGCTEENMAKISQHSKERTKLMEIMKQNSSMCTIAEEILTKTTSQIIVDTKHCSDRLKKMLNDAICYICYNLILNFMIGKRNSKLSSDFNTFVELNQDLSKKLQKHSYTMMKLKEIQNNIKNNIKRSHQETDQLQDLYTKIINNEKPVFDDVISKLYCPINEITFQKVKTILLTNYSIAGMQKMIFCSPVNQPVYINKYLIEKFKKYSNMLLAHEEDLLYIKRLFSEEMERISSNETALVTKTLWIQFLTDPEKLISMYEMLKKRAHSYRYGY